MKRTILVVATLALLNLTLGCRTVTSTTPPAALAPGFMNTPDYQMSQVLKGARTFYETKQCETKAMNYDLKTQACVSDPTITSPILLSPAEKSAFNTFAQSLNAAEAVYLAYHAGTATQVAAQTAVDTVKAQQSTLPALAVTK